MPTDHRMTLDEAIEMTTRYRSNREDILAEAYKEQNIFPLSETFEVAAFQALLEEPNIQFVRIYYGMSPDLKVHAILVGANEDDEDILPASGSILTNSILDRSKRCPPVCPAESVLNTDQS